MSVGLVCLFFNVGLRSVMPLINEYNILHYTRRKGKVRSAKDKLARLAIISEISVFDVSVPSADPKELSSIGQVRLEPLECLSCHANSVAQTSKFEMNYYLISNFRWSTNAGKSPIRHL